MANKVPLKKRLLSILFWSVISAAFIGPGTVTTAASAGASAGYALLWALVFSTIATLILQEASARITIASGLNLGQAIKRRYSAGAARSIAIPLVVGAIIFGSAAYETGNILGAVAGLALNWHLSTAILTLAIGVLAFILLWFGSTNVIAKILGILVAFMGILFLTTAVILHPPISKILEGSIIPSIPGSSGLLVLALVGTTVVPYNLFLGSGISGGQSLNELRFGLSIAIILGGIISMGILVVGAAVSGTFTFEALSNQLSMQLGPWAGYFFGFGLFAAGLSSAITAPLASSITAQSLFADEQNTGWEEHSRNFRLVWLGVLLIGIIFGLLGIKPIPAIILAQALNGIVLPFAAITLWIMVNDIQLMGKDALNGHFPNILTGIIVIVTIILGVINVVKALVNTFSRNMPGEGLLFIISGIVVIIVTYPLYRVLRRKREGK
ncbi:MAG TPA: divalent metal cation transporter [Balneolales bacterium]|nr:divalent metal cation transporter [Balneolales bacterium]